MTWKTIRDALIYPKHTTFTINSPCFIWLLWSCWSWGWDYCTLFYHNCYCDSVSIVITCDILQHVCGSDYEALMTMMANINEHGEACCCPWWCHCCVGIDVVLDTNTYLFSWWWWQLVLVVVFLLPMLFFLGVMNGHGNPSNFLMAPITLSLLPLCLSLSLSLQNQGRVNHSHVYIYILLWSMGNIMVWPVVIHQPSFRRSPVNIATQLASVFSDGWRHWELGRRGGNPFLIATASG